MDNNPIVLISLGGIARWMDDSVTHLLAGVIAPMVSHTTAAIWPFVTVSMTISLMWYGWLIANGTIQTPVLAALKRVVNIVIIVSIAGAGGMYETEIVGVMLDLPTAVTRSLTKEPTTVAQKLDDAANTGATIGTKINARAPTALTSPVKAFSFVLVSIVITVVSAVLSAIGIVVLVATKVGMGLVVVLGPFCLLALLFDYTQRFFTSWVNQAIYFAIFGALFTTVFTIVMGMFGMLQETLLHATEAKETNLFSMLTAIVVFMTGVAFMLTQVPLVAAKISGGNEHRGGISIPFLGKIG